MDRESNAHEEPTPLPIESAAAMRVVGETRRLATRAADLCMTAAGRTRWGDQEHALYLHIGNAILAPITRQIPRMDEPEAGGE